MKEQSKYQTTVDGMTKSYIWPLFNRVLHIALIVFFSISFILGDMDNLLDYHAIFGILFALLFVIRIIWGFIGPKYSKFKDFNFNKSDLKTYLISPFKHTKEYIGHNPASSFAIIAMMILSLFAALTGMLAYGIEKNHGIFSFLHSGYFKQMELFEELHEITANMLLGVIAIHAAGSLIDRFIKRGDAIDSMISGYKKLSSNIAIRMNIFQKIFAIISLVLFVYAFYYMISTKNDNIMIASAYQKQDYSRIHPEFANECGSCHITYPPYLLPKQSWAMMMQDLENHFGDDASIDTKTNLSISAFLKENSAENSTHEAAFKILKSLKENNSTIAITKTPYWKSRHKHINNQIFVSQEVKSKANCTACHQNIEYGLIENTFIKVPQKKG
ncbi:MAG: cytochrome b/b6 domain-containing protein [Sulfurovum sp.]|nr:cytochrome b/b6 domain-containing protein [Sulfurovum sp.]